MNDAFVPLRIEWRFATPWCPPPVAMHLDGLLAWAQVEEARARGEGITDFSPFLDNLPLAKHETPSGWVWKASMIESFDVLGSERRYMTRRTALTEFSVRMGSGMIEGRPLAEIDTVRGPYKNDAFWYTIEHAVGARAWCMGDPQRITELLAFVTHLGKRSRLDHGRVIDSIAGVVNEDPVAESGWQRRYMPEPVEGHVPAMGRLHPPYWMGEGARQVWRPL